MSEIKSITDQESHAPRERVSWNFNSCAVTILQWCHAPRERVSWNRVVHGWAGQRLVTLHVSVWVEIEEEMLRVSMGESRSTWACELKLYTIFSFWILNGHAPRERVSWNFPPQFVLYHLCVTLHVSVWVEMFLPITTAITRHVTLHVSVWVEIYLSPPSAQAIAVTLHVSVWVEIQVSVMRSWTSWVTLHVSVWVEMLYL